MLKAIGKYIDTMPLARLFSQEEDNVDDIIIEVDRFYGTHDLADFTFVMRGITKSGGETETELKKAIHEKSLYLIWNVSSLFTAEAGTLFLDLLAYCYVNPESDRLHETPDYLIRYQLPSVEVRGFPDNTHTLEGQSYSDMLVQIREAFGLASSIQNAVNEHAAMMQALNQKITQLQNDLLAMQNIMYQMVKKINDMPQITVMSQAEYNALEEPEETTLYILT